MFDKFCHWFNHSIDKIVEHILINKILSLFKNTKFVFSCDKIFIACDIVYHDFKNWPPGRHATIFCRE